MSMSNIYNPLLRNERKIGLKRLGLVFDLGRKR